MFGGYGMAKRQAMGVQSLATELADDSPHRSSKLPIPMSATVNRIADEGMACSFEMDSNLVSPAGV